VRAQDLAHVLQHPVTGVVTAVIVDLLEVVEIDDDDARSAEWSPAALR
jgi:hypothetical protein